MKLRILIAAVSFALAGCMTAQTAAFKPVAYTCASGAFLLETANDLRAKMSDQTKVIVTRAASVLNPICSQQSAPTVTSTAQAALSSALAELTGAVEGAQK